MYRLLSLIIMTLWVTFAGARDFDPNTKWPYIYGDFTEGTIYFEGNKKTEAQLNIHLWGNKLHYISESQKILEVPDKGVIRVEIGADAYIFSNHQLVKILSVVDNNLVVEQVKADFDALFTGTGAYGASLNSSSATDLSSLDLGGMNQPEIGLLLQERDEGSSLSVKSVYYLIIDGMQIDATKKSVEKMLTDKQKTEWKAFLKENTIKWKSSDSLAKVLTFIMNNK